MGTCIPEMIANQIYSKLWVFELQGPKFQVERPSFERVMVSPYQHKIGFSTYSKMKFFPLSLGPRNKSWSLAKGCLTRIKIQAAYLIIVCSLLQVQLSRLRITLRPIFLKYLLKIPFLSRKSRMMTCNSHLVAPNLWPNLTGFFIADLVHCSQVPYISNHLSWIWNELISGLGRTSGVDRQICKESCDWLVTNVWGKKVFKQIICFLLINKESCDWLVPKVCWGTNKKWLLHWVAAPYLPTSRFTLLLFILPGSLSQKTNLANW